MTRILAQQRGITDPAVAGAAAAAGRTATGAAGKLRGTSAATARGNTA